MHGLTIYFHDIQLNNNANNNRIRVNVITIPDNKKQSFTAEPRNMSKGNYFLRFNITDETKKLLFIFEKKSIFQNDQIIASKVINSNKLPKSPIDSNNMEVKTFKIYEPFANQCDLSNQNRKIIGKMSIQFFLSEPFVTKTNKNSYNICKIHNGEGYSSVNPSGFNENQSCSIFLDIDFIN